MLFDRQGRCLSINKFGLDVIQMPETAVKNLTCQDLWPEDILPQINEALKKVLSGIECSLDAHRPNGFQTTWWAVKLAPIHDEDGNVVKFISIATDISYRKKAEEERVLLYEQSLAIEKQHSLEKEQLLMDLHDGIGGISSNISLLAAKGVQSGSLETTRETFNTILQLSKEGIAEIRSFMHSLDSKEMSWHTLVTELKRYGAELLEPHGILFQFNSQVDDPSEKLRNVIWINIFRIYREALINVIKHAKANKVTINLVISTNDIQLTIDDNGIGFTNQKTSGRGISNIYKRAGMLGGNVTWSYNNGTLLSLTIPVPVQYIPSFT